MAVGMPGHHSVVRSLKVTNLEIEQKRASELAEKLTKKVQEKNNTINKRVSQSEVYTRKPAIYRWKLKA
jgi:hypothetical protein